MTTSTLTPEFNSKLPESVLITGGAGFVGSSLALGLKSAYPSVRVVAMDNLYRKGSQLNVSRLKDAGCEFIEGDIRNRGDFPDEPCELLLECSAEPSVLAGYGESPDYLMQTNLMGTYECLEKCREWNSGIIFFSTSRVYPIVPMEQHPWRETDTRFEWLDDVEDSEFGIQDSVGELRNPESIVHKPSISSQGVAEQLLQFSGSRSLYGFTKYSSELLIEEYRSSFGLQAIINRCSVIAGPWQMGKVDQGVVGLWVLRHYFQQPLSYIGYGGTGKQVRDVLHIDDLVDLIRLQVSELASWEGWCGNVGGGRAISSSLLELTGICQEVTGNKIPIDAISENRQADLRIFLANCSKIEHEYDWKPGRDVKRVVADTYEWIKNNEAMIRESGVA